MLRIFVSNAAGLAIQLELWSSGGVFVWVILESGGMNMFLQTVGPFQVLGEKLDRTFVLQVGVHLW